MPTKNQNLRYRFHSDGHLFANKNLARRQVRNRHGGMMVFIVFCMIILFVAAAMSIDVAYMHLTRAELRTATDASARAAVEALGRTQSVAQAREAALAFAARNEVGGEPLVLSQSDIVFGSNRRRGDGFEFVPGGNPPNSVRITGKRTAGSASGPVPLFFGNVFGQDNFQPVQVATASRADMDVALVLDISGSMNISGRYTALRNAVDVFIDELNQTPQDEVCSMSVYSHQATKVVPMTTQLQQMSEVLSRIRPAGATAVGLGMRQGISSFNDPLRRPFAFKSMIVMTDGNHNFGVNPLTVVQEAKQRGIVVHTITFSRGANQSLMRQVADAGDGIHLHANTDAQLIQAFKDIANQLAVVLIE